MGLPEETHGWHWRRGDMLSVRLSAVTRPKTMIESGNDARHVVCRETLVVPDILTLAPRAGQPGRTCQPVSLRACVIVCPKLLCTREGDHRRTEQREYGRRAGAAGAGTGAGRG